MPSTTENENNQNQEETEPKNELVLQHLNITVSNKKLSRKEEKAKLMDKAENTELSKTLETNYLSESQARSY